MRSNGWILVLLIRSKGSVTSIPNEEVAGSSRVLIGLVLLQPALMNSLWLREAAYSRRRKKDNRLGAHRLRSSFNAQRARRR